MSNNSKKIILILIPVMVIPLFIAVFYWNQIYQKPNTQGGNPGKGRITAEGDLVIPINEVTSSATFYPVEANGIALEVLAVKAPDGTIRTAFNTCQICYGSGRGYYIQEGNALVCQNCGNRYPMSEVEVSRGGCNPVPIFPEEKVVDLQNITIPHEFLEEVSVIFTNWKNQ